MRGSALVATALAAMLAGCVASGPATPPELSVRGRLDYPARAAILPDETEAEA